MDCNTARLLLEFAAPGKAGELEAVEAAELDAHLAGCVECATQARAQRLFDQEVGKAMRRIDVPDRLRDLLHKRLKDDAADARRRRSVKVLSRVGIAAGVLLMVVGGIVYWRQQTLPEVTAEQAQNDLRAEEIARLTMGPEDYDAAFRRMGVETVVPRGLKYQYVKSHALEDYQGQQVPMLVFREGEHHARVRILSARQFNLKNLQDFQSRDEEYSRLQIEVTPDRRYAYLIIYSGDDLSWLKQRGSESVS